MNFAPAAVATPAAETPAHTIQRIRLADQVERWAGMVKYYREHGMPTSARRAQRMLTLARRAAADETMIALVVATPAPAVDEALEADRAAYEFATSAAWEA